MSNNVIQENTYLICMFDIETDKIKNSLYLKCKTT